MTFDKFINWLVDNPEGYKFWIIYFNQQYMYVVYKISNNNTLSEIVRFYIINNDVKEGYTDLVICPKSKINLERFNELCKEF